jgi:hypothetical protein
VKVNDRAVNDPNAMLQPGEYIIRAGKRRFCKVTVEQ